MTATTNEQQPVEPTRAPDRATAEDPGAVPPVLTHGANVLTPRERKIVQLICYGHKLAKVAKRLGIATKTAEAHKSNAYRKLNIHNIADLTRWAIQHKICRVA